MTNKILSVFKGVSETPPPIWMMRQAGRHLPEYLKVRASTNSFIEFCFNPQKASQVTLQPVERYDMDAAILFADILLIPLALGRDVRFVKGTGPVLDPISVSEISKLTSEKVAHQLSPVYENVSLVRQKLAKNKTLIGFCGGPWTVATYMIEGQGSPTKEGAKRFAYENPKAMEDLLKHLAISSADYLIEQARAGADVLKIFESWAEGLSPKLFEKLVIAPTLDIISRVRAAGINKPIIGFPRGSGFNAIKYAKVTGIDGLALGTDVPINEIRKSLPENMVTQGNLDPLALRIGGKALWVAVQSVLDDIKGPHIFNLGHGVSPDVKIENIHAVINHVRHGDGDYV